MKFMMKIRSGLEVSSTTRNAAQQAQWSASTPMHFFVTALSASASPSMFTG